MKLERTATSYAVSVPVDDFLLILDREDIWKDTSLPPHEHLDAKLMVIGCTKVEYNGHFGANIYFTISYCYDDMAFRKKVATLIANHIKGLKS